MCEHTSQLIDVANQLDTLVSSYSVHDAHDLLVNRKAELVGHIGALDACISHIHSHVERSTFKKLGGLVARSHWSLREYPPPDIELSVSEVESSKLSLVFLVTTDAFIDGFMIGLCNVTSTATAVIMAVATSLEMFFLGLSYGSTLRVGSAAAKFSTLICLLLPPFTMIIAAIIGNFLGELLEENSLCFLGALSFAATSLIFLVSNLFIDEIVHN